MHKQYTKQQGRRWRYTDHYLAVMELRKKLSVNWSLKQKKNSQKQYTTMQKKRRIFKYNKFINQKQTIVFGKTKLQQVTRRQLEQRLKRQCQDRQKLHRKTTVNTKITDKTQHAKRLTINHKRYKEYKRYMMLHKKTQKYIKKQELQQVFK